MRGDVYTVWLVLFPVLGDQSVMFLLDSMLTVKRGIDGNDAGLSLFTRVFAGRLLQLVAENLPR
jgi:hypothetical protein